MVMLCYLKNLPQITRIFHISLWRVFLSIVLILEHLIWIIHQYIQANSLIQIAGFNQASSTRAYAQIRSETVTYDGSTNRYTLTYPPGAVGPYSGLTIIEVNGKILRGPDNSYFKGDGSTMSYAVTTMTGDDSTIDPAKTITSADEIEVYKNGTKLFHITEYTVDTSAQTVTLITAPEPTDVIAITTLVNHHYYNEGND